jgi:hypothetical protein
MNLNKSPSSSFYNMVNTMNDKDRFAGNNEASPPMLINTNSTTKKSLLSYLPSDFNVYLCLNCRLFFTSDSSFSHNCWNIVENCGGTSNGAENNSNNYFSPIYLKFNVSKFLLNSKAASGYSSNVYANGGIYRNNVNASCSHLNGNNLSTPIIKQ